MKSELFDSRLSRAAAEPCWSICRLADTLDPTATGGDASSVGTEEPVGSLVPRGGVCLAGPEDSDEEDWPELARVSEPDPTSLASLSALSVDSLDSGPGASEAAFLLG